MIKQVQSFRTSDDKLHTSRLDALIAEQKIEMRGVIQSGMNGNKNDNNLSIHEAVQICIANSAKISAIVARYNKSIRNERAKGAGAAVNKMALAA